MMHSVWVFALVVAVSGPPVSTAPDATERVAKAVEAAELLQQALGFRLKPTGFIAVNTVLNSGSALPSQDAPFFARNGSKTFYQAAWPWEGDGGFLITARQSRFGADASVSLHPRLDARGVLEFDLWALYLPGIPPGITAGAVRVRQAFLELGHRHLKLRAGQDLAVIAPRYPFSTSHLAVAAFTQAGFLWQRVAQMTLLASAPLSFLPSQWEVARLFLHASLVRPHSGDHDGTQALVFDTADPGTASLLPLLQGRAGYEGRHATVGVAGQAGVENHPLTQATGKVRARKLVETWLLSVDAMVKGTAASLQGQVWLGSNLNGMFGMTGVKKTPYLDARDQPVAGTARDVRSLRAVGGWMQAQAQVWPHVAEVFAGAGFEQTLDEDVVAAGERVTNAAMQLGVSFPVHRHVDFGVEGYHVFSRFRGGWDAHAWNENLAATVRVKL